MALTTSSAPLVAIVGRPNVGKSSLFNRLTGRRQAITHVTAGTTRDANYGTVEWSGFHFNLVDTAGLSKAVGEIEAQAQEQVRQVADLAQLIVVVVDAAAMVTQDDLGATRLALKSGKPVLLALNKVDTAQGLDLSEFRRLGVADIIETSAIHGRGTGDLLDAIVTHIDKMPVPQADQPLRLALLGRPNVGKSSLLNTLVGKQQAVVSAQAGTTRDTGYAQVKYHGQAIELLDTAGLRRRGKIEQGIEKYSALRTVASINEADVCVLLIDATEPSVAGDQHIAGMVTEAGKGLILVVNKWDAVDKDDQTQIEMTRKLQKDFQFAWWAPLVFVSAETGLNATKLFELATEIYARRKQELPTHALNTLLHTLTAKQPPAGLKNRQPKVNYVTQTGTNPPAFTFFATYAELIHFSYRRYLENGLRHEYDFTGTPIQIEFRAKKRDS